MSGIAVGHSQKYIGFFHMKIGKQGSIQAGILTLSGIYQPVGDTSALRPCSIDGTRDRRYFHKVRACPGNNSYFHIVLLSILYRSSVYFQETNVRFLAELFVPL